MVDMPRGLVPEVGDVPNTQCVGAGDRHVVVVLPRNRMTRSEALVHAAWIVAVAEALDGEGEDAFQEFSFILAKVRDT